MIMLRPELMTGIRQAIREVASAIQEDAKPMSWEQLDEKTLWREMVGGILGSRASYEVAVHAVEALERQGLLDGTPYLSRLSFYQRKLEAALSENTSGAQSGGQARRYPYPRQRAGRIRRSVEEIYGKRQTIREFLGRTSCPRAVRRELAERIPGIGPKHASMFLRNVGYPGEFAVLDVHVMTYMKWSMLLTNVQSRVRTLREYESVESIFLDHVHELGVCPRKFDVAVWIVMRVAKKEKSTCHW